MTPLRSIVGLPLGNPVTVQRPDRPGARLSEEQVMRAVAPADAANERVILVPLGVADLPPSFSTAA